MELLMPNVVHILLVTLMLSLSTNAVLADRVDPSQPVSTRDRPAYDPAGISPGGVGLYPSLGVEYRTDDNIFAEDETPTDDSIVVYNPRVVGRTGWSRHEVEAGVDIESARHSDNSGEDYEDYQVWASGRLDMRNHQMTGTYRFASLHEDRTSADDANGLEPTTYRENSVEGKYRYRPSRLFVDVGLAARNLNFDDTITTGLPVSNDDRDRQATDLSLRVGYSITPVYDIFFEARYGREDYYDTFDRDGFRRDSDETQALVGTTLRLSGKTFGEIFVGYMQTDYVDPRFPSADGTSFGVDLTWTPTGLTTLMLSASREMDSTTIEGASGVTETRFGISVDHELRRHVLISLDASALTEDFERSDRSDDVIRLSLQGKYLINRYGFVALGYAYQRRESTPFGAGDEFTKNTVFIRFEGQI
jgi:hypothetical protein